VIDHIEPPALVGLHHVVHHLTRRGTRVSICGAARDVARSLYVIGFGRLVPISDIRPDTPLCINLDEPFAEPGDGAAIDKGLVSIVPSVSPRRSRLRSAFVHLSVRRRLA
jgi:hypothetical protein